LSYRNLEFESLGTVLKAWLIYPPVYSRERKQPAVVMVHGYGNNRSGMIPWSAAIAKAGFLVFSFDMRASGESGGVRSSGGMVEKTDLLNATEFLRSQAEVDPERIAFYGHSLGASVVILAGAEDEKIKAVVADSPFSGMWEITREILAKNYMPPYPFLWLLDLNFRRHFGCGMKTLDVAKAAARISPRPLLILAGEKDRVIPVAHAGRVFKAAQEPKHLHVNPTGGHFDNAGEQTMREVIIPLLQRELFKES
jgi:dipeptidyl aminopeptidase/acylaminoacyl peptidase